MLLVDVVHHRYFGLGNLNPPKRNRKTRKRRRCKTAKASMPSKNEDQMIAMYSKQRGAEQLTKDKFSRLVYEPCGYDLFPVEEGSSDKLITLEVGPVEEAKSQRSFSFKSVLSDDFESNVVNYVAERPLGVTFEVDTSSHLRVVDLNPSSIAYQRDVVQRLQPQDLLIDSQTPVIGDVLLGFTTIKVNLGPRAVSGDLTGTKRAVVCYGCNKQTPDNIFKALAAGNSSDGVMTLVLERAKDPEQRMNWKPEEIPIDVDDANESVSEKKQKLALDSDFATPNATFVGLALTFFLLLVVGFP